MLHYQTEKYKIFCNAHYISHTGTRIPTTIRLSWWKSFFMSMLNSNFRWTTWFSWWQNSVTVSSYFFLITYSTPYTSIFHLQKIMHTPEYNNPVSRVPHQGVEHSLYFLCFILCLNIDYWIRRPFEIHMADLLMSSYLINHPTSTDLVGII